MSDPSAQETAEKAKAAKADEMLKSIKRILTSATSAVGVVQATTIEEALAAAKAELALQDERRLAIWQSMGREGRPDDYWMPYGDDDE